MENDKCVFGCEKKAKYFLKNGNKCCSKYSTQCLINKQKNSLGLRKSYSNGERIPLTHEGYKDKMSWRKNKNSFNDIRVKSKYKMSDIFCDNSFVSKPHLRKCILQLNIIPYKCSNFNCSIKTEWLGNKITLELDHINGNNRDNRLENLRFLCPNCHSQTPTFRNNNRKTSTKSKNITDRQLENKIKIGLNNHQIIKFYNIGIGNYSRLKILRIKLEKKSKLECLKCNKPVKTESKTGLCIFCVKQASRKIDRPPIEHLQKEINEIGYSATGRKYGVSDNAIRKWLKSI